MNKSQCRRAADVCRQDELLPRQGRQGWLGLELPSPAWSTLSMLCGDAASCGNAASPLSRTVVLWRARMRKIRDRKPYRGRKPSQ